MMVGGGARGAMESGGPLAGKARVLIVANDESRARPLAEGLDALGWRTLTARGPYAAAAALAEQSIEAAIIDLADAGLDALPMARRLKTASAPRRLPIIGLGEASEDAAQSNTSALALVDGGIDLALTCPLHPEQAAARLESLVRLAVAEEQFELCAQTFAEHGRRLEGPVEDGAPLRILAVGEPAARFLALSNALAGAGAEVVGAFTAYTAFDYLHERAFQAVVLWAGDDPAESLAIASGMRRNTRLFHVPAILCFAPGRPLNSLGAFPEGVSDLFSPDDDPARTARRVISLARAHRRESAIRAALERARGSGLMDAATGLFTGRLFAAHLARLAAASHASGRPLSVCILRIANTPGVAKARDGGWLARATPQIGSMIGRLVRVEDTAARLAPEVFAVALPATGLDASVAAAERIGAVIACTAFEAGDGVTPFVAEFEVGAAEIKPGQNAAVALEAAAARALRRARA